MLDHFLVMIFGSVAFVSLGVALGVWKGSLKIAQRVADIDENVKAINLAIGLKKE